MTNTGQLCHLELRLRLQDYQSCCFLQGEATTRFTEHLTSTQQGGRFSWLFLFAGLQTYYWSFILVQHTGPLYCIKKDLLNSFFVCVCVAVLIYPAAGSQSGIARSSSVTCSDWTGSSMCNRIPHTQSQQNILWFSVSSLVVVCLAVAGGYVKHRQM